MYKHSNRIAGSLAAAALFMASPTTSLAAGDGEGWYHAGPFMYEDGLLDHLWFDWDRQDWADKGVNMHLSYLSVWQDIVSGGLKSDSAITHSYDFQLFGDTTKQGWWDNGYWHVRVEGKGSDLGVNYSTGAQIPVNFDAIIPRYERTKFLLTEWWYSHKFAEGKYELLLGTWDVARFLDLVPHSGPYPYRHMNVNMYWNNAILPYAPYHALGGLFIVNPRPGLTITSGIADPNSDSHDIDWYNEGDFSLYHEWRFMKKDLFGKPALFAIGGAYMDKEQPTLAQPPSADGSVRDLNEILGNNRYIGTGLPVMASEDPVRTQDSDWAVYANFTTWLVGSLMDPRNVGLYGRIGVSDGDINPVKTHISAGIGFDGMIASRPRDNIGIAGWYDKFSSDLGTEDNSSYGLELHYRIQATPWLQITPDIQYLVKSGPTSETDDTVVVGLRAMLHF